MAWVEGKLTSGETVTPAQVAVLRAMWGRFGAEMRADTECYREIAGIVGRGDVGGVVDKLRTLRAKGYVESRGGSAQRPEAWVIRSGALSRARYHTRENRRPNGDALLCGSPQRSSP